MLLTAGLCWVCRAGTGAGSDAERSQFCQCSALQLRKGCVSVGSDPCELLPKIYSPERTKRDSLCHKPAWHVPPTLNFGMFALLLQEQVEVSCRLWLCRGLAGRQLAPTQPPTPQRNKHQGKTRNKIKQSQMVQNHLQQGELQPSKTWRSGRGQGLRPISSRALRALRVTDLRSCLLLQLTQRFQHRAKVSWWEMLLRLNFGVRNNSDLVNKILFWILPSVELFAG